QRVVAGCGQQAIWKIALVKDEALDDRLAVEPDLAVSRSHASQPEVAEDPVSNVALGVEQHRVDLVQRRRVGMPGSDGLQCDSAAARLAFPAADDLAFEGDDQPDHALGPALQINGPAIEIRGEPQAPEVTRGQRVEPDRLPDAGRRRVEDPLRFGAPELLAAWRGLVRERAVVADDQSVVASSQRRRDVSAERSVAALVTGDLDVVDPHGRAIVDRAEVQHHPLARRRVEPRPVPDRVARQLADPREARFGAEGDEDAVIEHLLFARAELPLSVQAHPVPSPQAWPRILGSVAVQRPDLPN